mmetsp:Transcript_8108/g.21450  ORF Transcript_8108/g.21450 Transcript_8108/m.21450 type:complete len:201 (-) Transcript_8108:1554-2156(-)
MRRTRGQTAGCRCGSGTQGSGPLVREFRRRRSDGCSAQAPRGRREQQRRGTIRAERHALRSLSPTRPARLTFLVRVSAAAARRVRQIPAGTPRGAITRCGGSLRAAQVAARPANRFRPPPPAPPPHDLRRASRLTAPPPSPSVLRSTLFTVSLAPHTPQLRMFSTSFVPYPPPSAVHRIRTFIARRVSNDSVRSNAGTPH